MNIYENKNYKLFVIIPVLMLLISLYFIPRIQLDSSLKGGVSISLHTSNSISNTTRIAARINGMIPGANAKVSRVNSNNISITINANTSLADAELSLLKIYAQYKNYSNATLAISRDQILLQNKSIANATQIANNAATQKTQQAKFIAQMDSSLKSELGSISSIIPSPQYNSSNAAEIMSVAQASYTSASGIYKKNTLDALDTIAPYTSYSYNDITPSLGQYFLKKIQQVVIISFILVAIAVFVIFRNPAPSLAVIFGAGNDIIVALGAMGAFGIPLGVASIGALLMLIGYSMDTDLLASVRILKRSENTASERAFSTMKTGLTMTGAAIIAFAVLFSVSYLTGISTFFEISAVMLFGLLGDVFTTWLGNTTLILWIKHRHDMRKSV
ncbi:MAG: hypothetical protein M1331_02195 [Candidatus Marsarchaeota archaeon]|nr:hypothetical protein [Candidatus Marsarchaeota archaeon]